MMKLKIYVCESFAPDYEQVIKSEKFEDVLVVKYPCLCTNRNMLNKTFEFFQGENQPEVDKVIICGNNCGILKLDNISNLVYKIEASSYCFNHLANEKLIEYIIENGGYIVTTGWLKSWKNRLEHEGFDRATAQKFYNEFSKEIVFLDTDIEQDSIKKIEAFSEYVNIPFRIVNILKITIKILF
jgi:hypothetical protein